MNWCSNKRLQERRKTATLKCSRGSELVSEVEMRYIENVDGLQRDEGTESFAMRLGNGKQTVDEVTEESEDITSV
jgi:hypothetical protein